MDSKDGETNVELMQVVVRAGPGSVPSRSTRSSSDAVDSSTPRKKGSKETKPSVSRMKMFEEYKKMPGSISLASGTNSKRSSDSGTERASEKMKTKKRKNKDYTIRVGSREDSQGSSIKKLEKLRTEGRRDSLAVNKIGTRVQARRKTVDEEAKQIIQAQARAIFSVFDMDGDDIISKEELTVALVEIMKDNQALASMTRLELREVINSIIKAIDKNEDGVVSFDEFVFLLSILDSEDGSIPILKRLMGDRTALDILFGPNSVAKVSHMLRGRGTTVLNRMQFFIAIVFFFCLPITYPIMFYYMLSEREESERELETFMSDETKKQKLESIAMRKRPRPISASHAGTAEFYDRLKSTWLVKLLEANGLAYGTLVYFFVVLPMFFFLYFNPFMYFWTMYENNIAGRRGSSITVMEVIVPPFFIVLLFSWISILVSIEEYRFDQVKWWQRLAKSPVVFPAVDDNVPEFVSASGVAKFLETRISEETHNRESSIFVVLITFFPAMIGAFLPAIYRRLNGMGFFGGYMFYNEISREYYTKVDNVTGAELFQDSIAWHEYVLSGSNILVSLIFITILLWVFENAVLQYLKIHDAVTFVSSLAEAGDALEKKIPYLDFRYKENIISWSKLRLYFRTFNRRSIRALEMFMGTILIVDAFALATFLAMIFLLKTRGLVNYIFRFNIVNDTNVRLSAEPTETGRTFFDDKGLRTETEVAMLFGLFFLVFFNQFLFRVLAAAKNINQMQENDKGMLARKILKLRYLVFAQEDRELARESHGVQSEDSIEEEIEEEDDFALAKNPMVRRMASARKREDKVRNYRKRQAHVNLVKNAGDSNKSMKKRALGDTHWYLPEVKQGITLLEDLIRVLERADIPFTILGFAVNRQLINALAGGLMGATAAALGRFVTS